MQRNKILIMLLIITFFLGLSLGTACTPQQKPIPEDNNNPGMGDTEMQKRNGLLPEENSNMDNTEAQKLAETIPTKVANINSATVVFAKEMAYVGIDLYANLSGTEAENVKKEVAKIVKEENPDIKTVYVTEDADTFTRLQKIAKDIENGKPLSGFLEELQNMFQRVTPSME